MALTSPGNALFVYGTLLSGESNHCLLEEARFMGEARTPPHFTLYDLGFFPAMVAGGQHSVEGEVYEVDTLTLERLDRLEGHPRFYMRRPILLASGAAVEAYLLTLSKVAGRPVVESGSWRMRRKEGQR